MGESQAQDLNGVSDGSFRRPESAFRNTISSEAGAQYPPEKDRYALYVNYGCPWAHRTILVRALKSLEPVIELICTDIDMGDHGWLFTGRNGSPRADPLYGFTNMQQLYLKADPNFVGRYTVPVLWDKKTHTIVNNESSEIIRILYSAFDDFLEPDQREVNKPGGGFYPPHLRAQIDAMNTWVYDTINNGVYKCGFAKTQEAYEENLYPLFKSLDRIESHLSNPAHQPYLFGGQITEADIRLYTTIARFDVAYHNIFNCNLKTIRHDYPHISKWLRNLYWDESDRTNRGVFKKTTFFELYKWGYLKARLRALVGNTAAASFPLIIPRGPQPDMLPLTDEEEAELIQSTTRKLNGLTLDSSATATATSPHANPFSAAPGGGMGALFGADIDSPIAEETGSVTTGIGSTVASPSVKSKVDDDGETGFDDNGEFHPRRLIKRRTTYNEENAKWYKAAKRAEKKSGAPNIHLAL
ncbi:hypothetical protein B0A52_06324 [Exophiala mesophila]|uniref:GST C-terminal domain-containing protein n=1 Tax=Exophiala mesophila TaxID=212818 RepID=A0A438N1S3_EXOME|nr:hypothetical protein B0A52_06324 [Exophiala mesophila]